MKPVLENIGCYDAPNLEGYRPADRSDVEMHIFLDTGRRGLKGTIQFTVFLATPKGLARLEEREQNILKFGRMLIIKEYDFDAIRRWLENRVARCEASDWIEVVERLRRHFDWEYEYDRR